MEIFRNHRLNGKKAYHLTGNDLKSITKHNLQKFMTDKTINIMFDYFDKFKEQHKQHVKTYAAPDIASILYDHPLNKLKSKILNNDINGLQFIQTCINNEQIITESTGWNAQDTYQVEAFLFQNQTLSRSIILNQLNDNDSLPTFATNEIRKTFQKFDLESIHYQIKNGKHCPQFSDALIDLIDDLNSKNTQPTERKSNDIFMENDLVKRIYNTVVNCFIWNDRECRTDENISSHRKYDWICFNCGNINFCSTIGNKMNVDISICILCGITESDSIMLNIRNQNTLATLKIRTLWPHVNEQKQKDNHDDVEEMQRKVISQKKLKLLCPQENVDKHCHAIIELSKILIKYKQALGNSGNILLHCNEVKISCVQFKNMFIEAVNAIEAKYPKIPSTQINLLQQMIELFNKNDEIISDIQNPAITNGKKKQFTGILAKQYQIKIGTSRKLYKEIRQTALWSTIDIDKVNEYYNHICEWHINNGNSECVRNVFLFFRHFIHYDDPLKNPDYQCPSLKRRNSRKHKSIILTNKTKLQQKNVDVRGYKDEVENYIQNRLDAIHCTLSHGDYRLYIPKYADQIDKFVCNENHKAEHNEERHSSQSFISYGYGMLHDHAKLSPFFNSIKVELLSNKICPIQDDIFQTLLIKSILTKRSSGNKLVTKCNYYDTYYNILRDQEINIRHIFAMTTYSDMTDFCTVFRETYRKMKDDDDIIARHIQFYFYARSLYESVQFFGCDMKADETVRHGLKCEKNQLYFKQFKTYFNQPMSTSSSFKVAKGFTNDGGIVLTLKSAFQHDNNKEMLPKYSNISLLSDFKEEEEKLFYGSHVAFRIVNITCIEGGTITHHSEELKVFNYFQDVLQNQSVQWNKDTIQKLSPLIRYKHNSSDNESKQKDKKLPGIFTDYGLILFNQYCKNLTKVTIKNFDKLPEDLYNALFSAECVNIQKYQYHGLSLHSLVELFPQLQEITFTDLDLADFIKYSPAYIRTIVDCIKMFTGSLTVQLERITFKTVQKDFLLKPDGFLQRVTEKYSKMLHQLQWKISYNTDGIHVIELQRYYSKDVIPMDFEVRYQSKDEKSERSKIQALEAELIQLQNAMDADKKSDEKENVLHSKLDDDEKIDLSTFKQLLAKNKALEQLCEELKEDKNKLKEEYETKIDELKGLLEKCEKDKKEMNRQLKERKNK
eukprot:208457_1